MTNCSLRFCSEYPDLLCGQETILWEEKTPGDFMSSAIIHDGNNGELVLIVTLTPVKEPLAKKEEDE